MKLNINMVLLLSAGIGFVLWQLLLPGYILTLDMVWGENLAPIKGIAVNLLPFNYLIYFLNFILPGWIIQKLFLIALFFCLFYLPYRFFPWPEKKTARLWFSVFFVFNPFVYERFLAGQWSILLAYAFLVPFIYYLFSPGEALAKRGKSNPRCLIWLVLISLFSLHLLVIGFFVLIVYFLLKKLNFNSKGGLTSIPLVFLFEFSHWQAFKTSSFIFGGSLLKVVMLYGFWAESYPWAEYFIWPKLFIAVPVFILLIGLIFLGIRFFYNNYAKNNLFFLLFVLISSIVFSTGVGDSIFKNLNSWLFGHIPFWSGFRDTTKWNALIVLIYGFFGSLGVDYLADKLADKAKKASRFILPILFSLPLVYTYPMIGGFARQLKPVWYPESWQEVNTILKEDKDCRALFLPWHLYLSLDFNRNLVTANPASVFFNCSIFSSSEIEIGDAKDNLTDPVYLKIRDIVIGENLEPNEAVSKLKGLGINYIVFYKALINEDKYKYNLLKSNLLESALSFDDIILYRITAK